MKRDIVVFGKDNWFSKESTIRAEGLRYSEFHWKEAVVGRLTITPSDPSRIGNARIEFLRYRIEIDGRKQARVKLLPNEYTLAQLPLDIWQGYIADNDNTTLMSVLVEALV